MTRIVVGMTTIGIDVIAGQGIPDHDNATPISGGDTRPPARCRGACWRPGNCENIGGMLRIGIDVFASSNTPYLHNIAGGNRDICSVSRPRHIMDSTPVIAIVRDITARTCIEYLYISIAACRDTPAIRRPRDGIPGCRDALRARRAI